MQCCMQTSTVSLLSSSSVGYRLVYNVCESDTSAGRPKVPFAVTSPDRLPNQTMLPNPAIFCLSRQNKFKQLCQIRQPNPKLLRGN